MCRLDRVQVSCGGRVGEIGVMSCSENRAGWAVLMILGGGMGIDVVCGRGCWWVVWE
jgi:hypothetical protein